MKTVRICFAASSAVGKVAISLTEKESNSGQRYHWQMGGGQSAAENLFYRFHPDPLAARVFQDRKRAGSAIVSVASSCWWWPCPGPGARDHRGAARHWSVDPAHRRDPDTRSGTLNFSRVSGTGPTK